MERKHAVIRVIPALVILDIIMCYLKNCSYFLEKIIHVHIEFKPFLVPIFKGFSKENIFSIILIQIGNETYISRV